MVRDAKAVPQITGSFFLWQTANKAIYTHCYSQEVSICHCHHLKPRTHSHTREVVYRGFQREDRLWDIEAEMRDTKTHAMDIPGEGIWQPGEPIHNLRIRVTIDDGFVVHEIAVAMDDVPHPECPMAETPMQRMIGCTMGPGLGCQWIGGPASLPGF